MNSKHLHFPALIALGLVMPASADVIYSNLQDLSIPANFDGLYLDVNGSNGWDINPFYGGKVVANSPAFQPVRSTTGNTSAIVNLGVNVGVGSGSVYSTFIQGVGGETPGAPGYGTSQMLTTSGGSFTAGTEGYIGFKLYTDTNYTVANYGWMRVVFTNDTGGAMIKDWAYDTSGAATVTGNVLQSAADNNAQAVTLTSASGSFTFGSVIADTGGNANSVLKTGAGTTVLAATSTYSGATTVTGGTLALTGSASIANTTGINVQSGASFDVTALSGDFALGATQTLQGAGTLNATGRNIVVTGTIVPGNGVGQMSVSTNTLQFGSASALDIAMTQGVTPSAVGNYGQLGLTGGISITPGASLNLTALGSGTWHLGDIYYLINNDGTDAISGAFNGYAEGASFSFASQLFKVTYQADAAATSFTSGNDMALQVIPETSAAPLGGLGMLALLRRRRTGVPPVLADGLPACRIIGGQAGRAVIPHRLEACSPIKDH